MKQLESSSDALEKLPGTPFWFFVVGPCDSPNFSHRRETIIHFREVALRFPWITPGPVDTQPSFASCVLAGNMFLIVGACLVTHVRYLSLIGPSLHLIQYVRQSCFYVQCLFDFIGADERIFAILEEARKLVVPHKFDEGFGVGFPI